MKYKNIAKPTEIYRDDKVAMYLLKSQKIVVSVEDVTLFLSHRWNLVRASQREEKYYLSAHINGSNQYLHRIITGADKGEIVDHENRNPLDCSRDNLRVVTSAVNSINRSQIKGKKGTNYKGVFRCKGQNPKKPYYSIIQKRVGKSIYCGSYKTEIEAANAYALKVKEVYGVSGNVQ